MRWKKGKESQIKEWLQGHSLSQYRHLFEGQCCVITLTALYRMNVGKLKKQTNKIKKTDKDGGVTEVVDVNRELLVW